MSSYSKEIEEIFEESAFRPKNYYEFNELVKGYFKVNETKSFLVNLEKPVYKNGQILKTLKVEQNSYLDAFYPDVWCQLNAFQKINAINIAFKDMVESKKSLKQHKVQLNFCINNRCNASQVEHKNKIIIDYNLEYILDTIISPRLLTVLAHELYHAEQVLYADQLRKKLKHNLKNNKEINLTEYQKGLLNNLSGSALTDFILNNRYYDILLAFEYEHETTHPDYHYVKFFDQIKKDEFIELLDIYYLLDVYEYGAFNKAANYSNKLYKYYLDNFDDCKQLNSKAFLNLSTEELIDKTIRNINKDLKLNITRNEFVTYNKIKNILVEEEKLKQGETITLDITNVHHTKFFESKVWECIKLLIDLYRDKKIEKNKNIQAIDNFEQTK